MAGCGAGGAAGAISSGGSFPTSQPIIITPSSQTTLPSVGTIWTYQQTIVSSTDPSLSGKSGTLTVTYNGSNTYRGGQYYTLQFQGIAGPPPPTNYFQRNNDGTFSEFAGAFYNFPIVPGCLQSPQQEDVLAQLTPFTVPGSFTVAETSYRCGTQATSTQAAINAIDSGSVIAATPGGTFQTHAVTGDYSAFGLHEHYTDYIAGITIIERDATFSDQAGNHSQTTTKYATGPLNVSFPGLSTLLAQDW